MVKTPFKSKNIKKLWKVLWSILLTYKKLVYFYISKIFLKNIKKNLFFSLL
jgi:hypothetical protein